VTVPPDIGRGVLRTLLTDPVTGALARGGLDGCLDGAIARARLTGCSCSVFVFDVDHFKTVNDAYGHARGDSVLRVIAERTMALVPGADLLVRYGGDEFVLVLPEISAGKAMRLASRLVEGISAEPFPGHPPLSVSISLGLATYPDDAADREALVDLADRRNYLAKRRGRGRAVADDLVVGGGGYSGRLLERDAAMAIARDFLVRLDTRGPGALRVTGERGAGHSRFLAEVGKLASMCGFDVRAMGHAADGTVDGATGRVLVLADTDVDGAELKGIVRELTGPGGARVVGLLQAVVGAGEQAAPVPLLGTVVLSPLSTSALHVWLRTTLRGEPTPALVHWLARRSGGLVARAERELARLSDAGHLEQAAGGAWAVAPAMLDRADRVRRRLPAALSNLVGRDSDTARVVELLAGRRLVTLVGPGGIGKTRLSLAVAHATADEFVDGAAFVSLAEATTTEMVVSAVAGVLEVTEVAGEPLADTVIRALSGLGLLLVLDNFEQVLSAGPFVATLLAAVPGVRVLATSRQRLRVTGEQVYPVPPLPVPDLDRLSAAPEDAAAVLDASPALELFVTRAKEAVYGLTFTPADLRAAAQVCCRLDGLPLAIELAAANCDVLPPARILAQLNERLELPIAGPQDLPARQRTLQATMDWSFALLDAGDQKLMTHLAVFAGGCLAEAVQAVCRPDDADPGALSRRLSGLVDRNLLGVRDTPDGPRYSMLETIRMYAAGRLAATGDEQVPRRHAAYFAEFADRAALGLSGAENPEWHARVGREYLNLRAAYTWAMADGDRPTAARIVLGVHRSWRKGWHIREGRAWHARLLTMTAGQPLPESVRARLIHSAADLAAMQDDYVVAGPLSEECLRLGRHLADPDLIASALSIVGLVARQTGDLDRAHAHLSECVAMQEARGVHDVILAAARHNLSFIAVFDGDLDTAHELGLRNLELNRTLGNLRGYAFSLANLGLVRLERGDTAGARPLFTEARAVSRQIADPICESWIVRDLGRVARLDGDPVEAYHKYTEAIRLADGVGQRMAAVSGLIDLIDLLSTMEPARAARLLAAVEAIRDRDGLPMTKHERAIRDATVHRLATALSEPDLAAATAAGRTISLDDVVAEALAVDPAEWATSRRSISPS
jgi:diguanylate cyclase (GGDEF)-like protein